MLRMEKRIKDQIKNYIKKNPEILMVLYLPVYIVWFALSETLITTDYYVSYMPLDDKIPFVPQFVLPYITWYPYLLLPILYLYIKDRPAYIRYGAYLIITLSVSLAVCCILPNGQELRPADTGDGLCGWIIRLLYAADTNTNVLPSMHVASSLGTIMAYFDSKKLRKLRLPSAILGILICLSTVFIKQHSLLDVIWGAVLAAVAGALVYIAPRLVKKGTNV